MSRPPEQAHVVIVVAGFAGIGCAKELAKHDDVRVTLIDRHNYHQFQPLLYQVATSQLAPSDIAYSLRKLFADDDNVTVRLADVTEVDPATHTVTTADGDRIAADDHDMTAAVRRAHDAALDPGAAADRAPIRSSR